MSRTSTDNSALDVVATGNQKIAANVLDSCAEVSRRAFSAEPWNEQWTPEDMREYLNKNYADGGGTFVTIRVRDEIVGFACGIPAKASATMREKISPPPNDDMFAPHVFYVGEVAVLPDCSYPGMGISLVKALINAARQDGFTTFFTVTRSDYRAVKKILEWQDFKLVGSGLIYLGAEKNPVDYYKMEIHEQSAP